LLRPCIRTKPKPKDTEEQSAWLAVSGKEHIFVYSIFERAKLVRFGANTPQFGSFF
jgi:hypothetical protein